ncbi:MAG: ABC transporter ATP-binding protein, partial [Alphaproteobacteria bacterium]|nr:ABC transporter ATP-binding protein [Alphaproteobacteria bacterium]
SMLYTIGDQIIEGIQLHLKVDKEEARKLAIEMLRRVGIPNPEGRIDAYPFQLSGGLRQRAMIAMALSCNPRLLIADEPTTALDVTTQAQILELMLKLQKDYNMSVMMITHDLGVVAEICDEVVVMYLGTVVERTTVDALFHDPQHPYTKALLHSIPKLGQSKSEPLNPIKGSVPDPFNRPQGCP